MSNCLVNVFKVAGNDGVLKICSIIIYDSCGRKKFPAQQKIGIFHILCTTIASLVFRSRRRYFRSSIAEQGSETFPQSFCPSPPFISGRLLSAAGGKAESETRNRNRSNHHRLFTGRILDLFFSHVFGEKKRTLIVGKYLRPRFSHENFFC